MKIRLKAPINAGDGTSSTRLGGAVFSCSRKTNIYWALTEKGGLRQFSDLREGDTRMHIMGLA